MAKGQGAAGKAARSVKAAHTGSLAISPLAPKRFANLPPLAGVRLSTGEAGVKYKDRTDVLLAVFRAGHERGGRFHQIQDGIRAGRVVQIAPEERRRARACREQRQCERLHRQGRPGGHARNRAIGGGGHRLPRA